MRERSHHSRTVAGLPVGCHGAAMTVISQGLKAHLQDVVSGLAVNTGDEADPTSVALEGERKWAAVMEWAGLEDGFMFQGEMTFVGVSA